MALVAVVGALAGCGSSSTPGSSADPATAIPASAPLFASATVRPSGSLKTAAQAAGTDLTHQADPYLRLLGALQTPGAPQLSYKRDIAPWLGSSAGVYLSSLSSASSLLSLLQQGLLGGSSSSAASFPFSASGAQGAIVLDTSDASKARGFLSAQAAHAGAHSTSYHGVSFELTTSGVAFGLVNRLAVIGSESGMHSVIETIQGGASLEHSSGYAKLLAKAPAGVLAHLYSNPAGLKSASTSSEGVAGLLHLLTGASEANVSLVPASGSLTLDADTLSPSAGASSGLLSSDPEGAKALGELPGESWLAVGLGHVGSNLAQDIKGLRTLSALGGTPGVSSPEEGTNTSTLSVKSLLNAMIAPLGVLGAGDAQSKREFASWMGSAGIFASGASLLELKAAVVISSTNPVLSRAAVAKLATKLHKVGGSTRPVSLPETEAATGVALPGLPVILDIAAARASDGQSKFVMGFGEASVKDALAPPNALSGAPSYAAASSALGEGLKPSLMLDFPTLLSLLEGVGLTEDPSISKFVPYLRALTTLAGGAHEIGGGVQRLRVTLGLQHAAG
jgi:Protein of unknown function (DUF3352)